MIVPRPKGRGIQRAIKKYQRLASRGARTRTLTRLASRIQSLEEDFMRRLHLHQAETKLRALFDLIASAIPKETT